MTLFISVFAALCLAALGYRFFPQLFKDRMSGIIVAVALIAFIVAIILLVGWGV